MANELTHKTVGTQLTQAEYEAVGGHVLDSQAAGDIIYASSTSQLSRLGIGTAGQILHTNSGASAPEWTAAITGATSILNAALVIGRDADNDIDFATDNNIIFRAAGADQIKLVDGVLQPVTDNDIDLGTSTYEFKDAYFDGTITTDLLTVSGTTNLDGAIQVDNTITVGVDDTGYDIKFFGATSGSFLLWDESDDALELTDSSPIKIGDGGDMQIYHDGSNSYITNSTGALKIATESSGIAVTIGHTTSEVTIADNLTVTGTLTLGSNAELTEAELEMLDGITAGTAAASKAVVLDSNKDIATLRNLTIDGVFTDGNYTFDTSGNVSGLGTVSSGAITSTGSSSFATAVKTPKIQYTDADDSMTIADGGGVTFAAGLTSTAASNTLGATSFNDANITNVGDIDIDTLSADDNDIDIVLTDNRATALEIKEGSNTYMTFVTTNSSEKIQVGANDAGYDVIFYGDTASANMTWDTSADDLILNGGAGLIVPDGQLTLGSTAIAATATEINTAADGNTSVGTTAVSDGHGIVMNHGGTMAQTTVQTLAAYLDDEITAMPNLTSFGTLTTLTVDNIIINGTNIGHTSDTDSIAIASDGVVTMNQIPVFSAGINVSGGSIAGTLSTAAQANVTSLGTLTTLTVDNVIINGTTIGHTSDTDLLTLTSANLAIAGAMSATTGTFSGILKTDDATDATSTTDGSLQTDGGLSVVKDGVIGNDLLLLSDSSVLKFGADSEATITHANDAGLTFNSDITTASHKYIKLPENSSIKFTDQIGVDNSIDNDDGQGVIFTFRTGATVTPFSPVYIDGNNEVQECNANAIATMPCVGVSMNSSNVTADNDIEVMLLGLIRHDSFTDFGAAGAPVYASTTVGTMTTSAPSGEDDVVQIIGHSIAEDLIFVQPCLTTIEHAA